MKPVTFAWTPVTTDAQGAPIAGPITYKVYAAPLLSAYPTTPTATTTETSVTIPMGAVGQHKSYVTASAADGDSAQSNIVNFPSVLQIPAAPTGLTVS